MRRTGYVVRRAYVLKLQRKEPSAVVLTIIPFKRF
jgi:hypothetical protein